MVKDLRPAEPFTVTTNPSLPFLTSTVAGSTGTLTLAGANTSTTGVTHNAGTLNINNATALGTAGALLDENGIFVAYQSKPPDIAERDIARSMDRARLRLLAIIPYTLPGEERERCLAAFRKGD